MKRSECGGVNCIALTYVNVRLGWDEVRNLLVI